MFKKFIGNRQFYRHILSIMIPILIQNVITNFVSLLDNLMVGQLGTEPMSGVAIINELLFVYNICVFGCIEGADIFTAQFYGKGDIEGVRKSFRLKLILLLSNFAIFTSIFLIFGKQLISMFISDGSGDVDTALTFNFAQKYLKIAMFQMLPFGLVQLYSGTLKCSGETVIPMKAGIAAVAINGILNYILIFGKLGIPALGVEGAALATVIARISELLIVVLWSHSHKKEVSFVVGLYSNFKIPKELSVKILKMGLPLFCNELFWSVGNTIQNQCFSTRGIDVVPAINITNTVYNLFCCAMFAMGNTIAIVIGHRLGAGKLKEAVEDDNKLLALTFIICLSLSIIMILFAPVIPNAYNTTDVVKDLAKTLLIMASIFLPVDALVTSCYFTLRSGGKSFYTLLFDSCFTWILMVPAALILSSFTDLAIIPLFGLVKAIILIKCVLGVILVCKKVWVNNLVGD